MAQNSSFGPPSDQQFKWCRDQTENKHGGEGNKEEKIGVTSENLRNDVSVVLLNIPK